MNAYSILIDPNKPDVLYGWLPGGVLSEKPIGLNQVARRLGLTLRQVVNEYLAENNMGESGSMTRIGDDLYEITIVKPAP